MIVFTYIRFMQQTETYTIAWIGCSKVCPFRLAVSRLTLIDRILSKFSGDKVTHAEEEDMSGWDKRDK